jgi:hypothetical protein
MRPGSLPQKKSMTANYYLQADVSAGFAPPPLPVWIEQR